jgi:hypothetical protein
MSISSSNLLTFVLRVSCRWVNDINTWNKLPYLYYTHTTQYIRPIEQHVSTVFTNFKNIRKTGRSNGSLTTTIFQLYKNKGKWNNTSQAEVLHQVLTSIFHFSVSLLRHQSKCLKMVVYTVTCSTVKNRQLQ